MAQADTEMKAKGSEERYAVRECAGVVAKNGKFERNTYTGLIEPVYVWTPLGARLKAEARLEQYLKDFHKTKGRGRKQ
jgi:hypothetical protein